MPHPDEGLIHAWLDGELDAAEAARVEELVKADAEWAAAAAEARGLIAASARIVGALDRVPANVVPKAASARTAPRRWAWRAAAVLALMAGSAIVLKREKPELPTPSADHSAVAVKAAAPTPAPVSPAIVPAVPPPHARAEIAKALKPDSTVRSKPALEQAKSANSVAADKDLSAGAPAVGRRALNAPMAAKAEPQPAAPAAAGVSARAAAPMAQNFATQRLTRLPMSCFEQLEPHDSTAPMIRLSAAALADSIRLETFVLRGGGDTLAAVNRPFIAVRVRCPEP